MKFLKAFFVVVLLVISALLIIGVFVPEIDEQVNVTVEQPIISVYAGMLNTQGFPKWMEDLERVERTSGFLAMPGSTFTLYFKNKETAGTYTLEILEVVPMKSVRCRMYNEMIEMEANINFESNGPTTDIDAFFQIKGQTLVERAMLPLMKTVLEEELKQHFLNFKKLQEE